MEEKPVMKEELVLIPLEELDFDGERNCRLQILPIGVKELADSILEHGLQQPIRVCPKNEDGKHIVVMGYRRCHAHRRLTREGNKGYDCVKAIIDHEAGTDESKFKVLNLTENLHRQNLNMLEEAKALVWFKDQGMGRSEIASAVGMGDGWVQMRLMLLELPEEIQIEAALGWLKDPIVRQLHTIYKKRGKLAVYSACKKAKEARERGEKIRLVQKRRDPLRRRKASEIEIREMRDKIYKELGPEVYSDEAHKGSCWAYSQMACRALAWALGDISDYDLISTMKAYGDKTGNVVEVPSLEY